ncbi:APC family permease [Geodermatophilaceae bacterium NBWT11]|nr:APC family permease [Geodermatophilaceae bacterium NBWT11]
MSTPTPRTEAQPQLKSGAIGFVDALVIGLASTSPAYSLAAVVGAVVALVGVYAPGVFLASFVPMLLIASAFYYLNRADQDCGTTFSWVTRAMGPWIGWLGGWAIAMTGVLVIGSLADVGVRFGLLALQLDGLAGNTFVVRTLTVLLIIAMTAVCVIGTEFSAKLQNGLIIAQVGALLVFAGIALVKGLSGDGVEGGGLTPSLSWLNPFGAGGAALTGGLLLGVFIYWGWESAVNLTEETQDSESTPGKAAIVSTVVLLVTYLGVTIAILSYFGTAFLADRSGEEETIFATLATEVMGPWDWVLLAAVSTSAIASTQTTILPASRTGLSMARRHAMPSSLARISPRFRTPDVSTWTVAAIAIAWYLVVNLISENALFDSLTALSLLIAFYYSLTGIACAVFHRRQLTRSVKDLLLIGVGPVIGSLLLIWLLVESIGDLADPANSYSGVSWFGVGPPLVIGIGIFLVGVVFMFVWRVKDARFWAEKTTTAERLQADIAAGRTAAAVEDPAP